MAGSNMLVGQPVLGADQAIPAAADRIVGNSMLAGGRARQTRDNPPFALALMVLAAVGALAALQLGGFRSTIAIGRT